MTDSERQAHEKVTIESALLTCGFEISEAEHCFVTTVVHEHYPAYADLDNVKRTDVRLQRMGTGFTLAPLEGVLDLERVLDMHRVLRLAYTALALYREINHNSACNKLRDMGSI